MSIVTFHSIINEPLSLGYIALDQLSGDKVCLYVKKISLGTLIRINNRITLPKELNDPIQGVFEFLTNNLESLSEAIVLAYQGNDDLIDKKILNAIREQWSLAEYAAAIQVIVGLVDIEPLYSHYKFKSKKTASKAYPGSKSLYAFVMNNAILMKGWSEHAILWEIPYRNLIMYSLCYPSYENNISDDKPNGPKKDNDGLVDMFDFFDNYGK